MIQANISLHTQFLETDSHKSSCNFECAFQNHNHSSVAVYPSLPQNFVCTDKVETPNVFSKPPTNSHQISEVPSKASSNTPYSPPSQEHFPNADYEPFQRLPYSVRETILTRYLRFTLVQSEGRSTFCSTPLDSADVLHLSIVLLRQEVVVSWMIAQHFFPSK